MIPFDSFTEKLLNNLQIALLNYFIQEVIEKGSYFRYALMKLIKKSF